MSDSTGDGDEECAICWRIAGSDEFDYRRSYNALHSSCDKCSISVNTTSPYLCSTCNHLRIPHSVGCVDHSLTFLWGVGYSAFFSDLLDRAPECHLCRMVVQGIQSLPEGSLYGNRDDINTIEFHLGIYSGGILVSSGSLRDSMSVTLWKSSTQSGRFHILGNLRGEVQRKTVPILDALINWSEVSTWLNTIVEPEKDGLPSYTPKRLKVIDVHHDRVVDAPAHCQYLALSYVFGNVKSIKISSSGSFDRHQLPATIQDAVIACQKMGFRFLWVDQLCINQKDHSELQEQIDQMNHIYRNASCTLVAQAGEDSFYGLPGVSHGRKWEQITLPLYDDIMIQLSQPLTRCMEYTKWASRGWTFQEEVFSQKLVFFTDCGLVYLDKGLEQPRLVSENLWDSIIWSDYFPLDSHWSALQRYTARNLTFISDKIRAFTAVLNEHYGQDNHHYGIPLAQIDQAMLWIPYSLSCLPTRIERIFPSWSWASHGGEIRHISNAAPLAIWAKPENTPTVNMRICKPAPNTQWEASYDFEKKGLMACICAAWAAGCINRPFPGDNTLCTATISRLMARWPTSDSYWEEAIGPQLQNEPFSTDNLRLPSSVDRLFVVHCQVAYFDVHHPTERLISRVCGKRIFCIRSSSGSLVGAIYLPGYHEAPSSPWTGEFLLLSVSYWPYDDVITAVNAEADDQHIVDVFYQDEHGQRVTRGAPGYGEFNGAIVVDVMLIERTENCGIARRVGVGQIFLKRWAEAKRQFQTVVLE